MVRRRLLQVGRVRHLLGAGGTLAEARPGSLFRRPDRAQRIQVGTGEGKGGYQDIDLHSVFVGGNSELDGFLDQVMKDADRCGGKPMLCWKRDRSRRRFVPTRNVLGIPSSTGFFDKEWSAVALEELLKLPDSFFLQEKCNDDAD